MGQHSLITTDDIPFPSTVVSLDLTWQRTDADMKTWHTSGLSTIIWQHKVLVRLCS